MLQKRTKHNDLGEPIKWQTSCGSDRNQKIQWTELRCAEKIVRKKKMQGSLMCFLSFLVHFSTTAVICCFGFYFCCILWALAAFLFYFFMIFFLFCNAFGLSGPDFFWTRSILLYIIHVFHHILKGSVK